MYRNVIQNQKEYEKVPKILYVGEQSEFSLVKVVFCCLFRYCVFFLLCCFCRRRSINLRFEHASVQIYNRGHWWCVLSNKKAHSFCYQKQSAGTMREQICQVYADCVGYIHRYDVPFKLNCLKHCDQIKETIFSCLKTVLCTLIRSCYTNN